MYVIKTPSSNVMFENISTKKRIDHANKRIQNILLLTKYSAQGENEHNYGRGEHRGEQSHAHKDRSNQTGHTSARPVDQNAIEHACRNELISDYYYQVR